MCHTAGATTHPIQPLVCRTCFSEAVPSVLHPGSGARELCCELGLSAAAFPHFPFLPKRVTPYPQPHTPFGVPALNPAYPFPPPKTPRTFPTQETQQSNSGSTEYHPRGGLRYTTLAPSYPHHFPPTGRRLTLPSLPLTPQPPPHEYPIPFPPCLLT